MLLIVTEHINMLICILGDIMDCKLIERGQFKPRIEEFNPEKALKFITRMFTG